MSDERIAGRDEKNKGDLAELDGLNYFWYLFRRAVALLAVLLFLISSSIAIVLLARYVYIRYWYKPEVVVPSVIGMRLEDAKKLLSEAHLVPEYIGYVESEVPPERVARQIPEAGIRVKEGRKVKLFLSLGRQGGRMADLFGLSIARVETSFRKLGIDYELYKVKTNMVPPGTIIAQVPDENAPITPETKVSLFIADNVDRVSGFRFVGETLESLLQYVTEKDIDLYEVSLEPITEDSAFSNLEVTDIVQKGGYLKVSAALDYKMPVKMRLLSFSVNLPPHDGRYTLKIQQEDYLGPRVIFKALIRDKGSLKIQTVVFGTAKFTLFIDDNTVAEFSF